jgi:hypothetical protein
MRLTRYKTWVVKGYHTHRARGHVRLRSGGSYSPPSFEPRWCRLNQRLKLPARGRPFCLFVVGARLARPCPSVSHFRPKPASVTALTLGPYAWPHLRGCMRRLTHQAREAPMNRLLLVSLLALFVLPAAGFAQKRCKKGIPCGNTCIAATKTCRIGPTPAPQTTSPRRPLNSANTGREAAELPWVASSRGHTYYRRGCGGANKLSRDNLIYFKTEGEAQQAGYQRSSARGC